MPADGDIASIKAAAGEVAARPHLSWKAFDDLDVRELYAVLRLRCEVFVVEQNCAFAEIDGEDVAARHLLAWSAGDAGLAGCLRVFAPDREHGAARIGRVATAAKVRGTGLGRRMMQEALAEVARCFGRVEVEVAAQVEVEPFYAALGFVRVGDPYLEDGIAHCPMRRGPPAP